MSVLSGCPYKFKRGLRYKDKDTCIIDKKTRGRHFYCNKMFKFYFSFKKFELGKPASHLSYSWRNLSSNQAEILTALSHCLGSYVIVSVTVTATTLNQGNRTHIYSPSTTLLLLFEYCP